VVLPDPQSVWRVYPYDRVRRLRLLMDDQWLKVAYRAPCRFVSDACLPLNPLGGNTAPRRGQQVHHVKPRLEWSSAPRKHGPFERVNVIPAMIAGVGCTAGYARMLTFDVAFLALGDALRPTLFFYVFKACIIIWKVAVQIGDRIAQICRLALFELLVRQGLRARAHGPTCFQGLAFFGLLDTGIGQAGRRWLQFQRPAPAMNTDDNVSKNSILHSNQPRSMLEDYLALQRSIRPGTL
jgi:hypothetical protein